MFITRAIGKAEQRDLCLHCRLSFCHPESRHCSIRQRVNELQRIRYHRNLEKSRRARRKASIPLDQYEKKRAYMRDYYKDNKDIILMKMAWRDCAKQNKKSSHLSHQPQHHRFRP